MNEGIFDVKTDQKAQHVTVEGTIEEEKLVSFLRKRVHKNVEIVSIKEVKKEEKKIKEEEKSLEIIKEKDHGESTKKKGGEITKIIETLEGHQKEDLKIKDNAPIIHYVYAPQLFSDENPNSCSIL